MFFKKNRKTKLNLAFLLVFLVVTGVVFIAPEVTYAGIFSSIGEAFLGGVKVLLYGIFVAVGLLASVGVTIFEWAINPNFISGPAPFGFFNSPGVYAMWKFVRDFFNLFFILTFLYIAFTIVFQIAGDYKKEILSLVLAALFVNFSFPITRFMIDAANVPMYFFANEMGGASSSPGKALGSTLSASSIKDILIPGAGKGINAVDFTDEGVGVAQLLMAIIFLFIFSISLVTIGIMLVIRMATLLILLIFSSVGFAASVIPGLSKYSRDWWDAFVKNALFGPVIMLMLFVVTRLFAETSNGVLKDQLRSTSQNVTTGGLSDLTAAMAQFSIPMVLLWIAIGVAKSSSVAGAGTIIGKGQDFTKWLGKKVTYNNPVGRGIGGGLKKAGMEGKIPGFGNFKYANYGKIPGVGKFLTGDYWASPSVIEATVKGGVSGGWGSGAKERKKLHQKAVLKKVKEDKENQVSDSEHINNLDSKDDVEREAAALSLAESKGIRNSDVLFKALKAIGANQDAVNKVLENAKPEAWSGLDAAKYKTLRESFYEKDPSTGAVKINPATGKPQVTAGMEDAHEAFNSKIKKEGKTKLLIDYEITTRPGVPRQDIYNEILGKMSAEDVGKVRDIHGGPGRATDPEVITFITDQVHSGNWTPKEHLDAYSKLGADQKTAWRAAGINP